MNRWLLCLLMLSCAAVVSARDDGGLPDMGSSAGQLLTPAQERMYGEMMVRQLRGYELLLDDPLLEDYLQALGHRLAARSDRPRQELTFFMMRSRQINAFATIGGFIGVNAGLMLTAEREDEVAAVLSHEIAHVTQRHVLRSVEQAQRNQLPVMLGMLGAILASSQAGSGDGIQAAILGGMSLLEQQQINYTRSNEHEADRLGIQTLARAGFDPDAMADFFARMERQMRGNTGGAQAPEYLRTHPVTTTRIGEAKARAERIRATNHACGTDATEDGAGQPLAPECPDIAARDHRLQNPLLPDYVAGAITQAAPRKDLFAFARERLRVLSAANATAAVNEYQRLRRAGGREFSRAQRYGLALAQSLAGQTAAAQAELAALAADPEAPELFWLDLLAAENQHRAGDRARAEASFDALSRRFPGNTAITLSHATALAELGDPDAARKAEQLLRPLLSSRGTDPAFQRIFARASEEAGNTVRAAEAWAEVAWLNGRADDALNQLDRLRKRDDLDFYQRSRIEARIAAITPVALEMRRQNQRETSVSQLDREPGRIPATSLRMR